MHLTLTIEEMAYRAEDRTLLILAVDPFRAIVTLEVKPVYPRQLSADLDFMARNPGVMVVAGPESPAAQPMAEVADGS